MTPSVSSTSNPACQAGNGADSDKRSKSEPGGPRPRNDGSPGCRFDIHIESRGDVHVHNHCAPPPAAGCETAPPACCPPTSTVGTCIAPVAGRKHKRSRDQKLQTLAANVRVPSALAASSVHLIRRFVAGKPAANGLESAAFATLARMTAPMRQTMPCAIAAFDALPPGQRAGLFAAEFDLDVDQPVAPAALASAWVRELTQRAGVLVFGDPDGAEQERPGRVRVYEPPPEDFFSQVRICSVNDLRTVNFIPPLAAGDLRPGEVQQDCSPVIVGGQPQVVCQVRTTDCPGQTGPGVCMRVPDIAAGDAVVLQGVNFFSVNATVRLTARAPVVATRDIDAHVWGDVETPVTEPVGNETRLVNDCRVHDRITFRVPDDLPPAIYEMRVIVPNLTGIAAFGDHLESNVEFINVQPPPTARFQISSDALVCREETSPGWIGSDEVGLNILALSVFADLSFSQAPTTAQRFGDVDSGERRDFPRVLFDQQQPIIAVAMAVMGYEVDGEDAYNDMVTDWKTIFVDLVKEQLAFIAGALAVVGGAALLAKLGPIGWLVIGIAAAVLAGIDLVIALWAPADPIINDPTGYTIGDLITRTSANFPAPDTPSFSTENSIVVNVTPIDKIALQYRERREYVSADEESRYEIEYRFNRVA